ncbi:MAG: hypothetical protein M3Z66_00145 [Chloroflexota bacterium]|nr:hypothetical protein [Chloroflexota bacterium]
MSEYDDTASHQVRRGRRWWPALASLIFGLAALLLGGYLVRKLSPFSDTIALAWLLVALGIFGLVIAFGFITGAYSD